MRGEALDFFVLTGFLGSGKTLLLRDFLQMPEAADTAVIVNEAGEIGLDGIVLRESGDNLSMATLSNGCVCCQIGSDLAFTIDRLITGSGQTVPDPCSVSFWKPAGFQNLDPYCGH